MMIYSDAKQIYPGYPDDIVFLRKSLESPEELEPDEKSMKVEKWECSDPANYSPPVPLLGASPPNFYIPARIWQIGKRIFISHGFVDGIHGYFVNWDDPRAVNKKEPAGARPDGTMGRMGECIEIPYERFINGEAIILKPEDAMDHSADDTWQWQTSWIVTINPDSCILSTMSSDIIKISAYNESEIFLKQTYPIC